MGTQADLCEAELRSILRSIVDRPIVLGVQDVRRRQTVDAAIARQLDARTPQSWDCRWIELDGARDQAARVDGLPTPLWKGTCLPTVIEWLHSIAVAPDLVYCGGARIGMVIAPADEGGCNGVQRSWGVHWADLNIEIDWPIFPAALPYDDVARLVEWADRLNIVFVPQNVAQVVKRGPAKPADEADAEDWYRVRTAEQRGDFSWVQLPAGMGAGQIGELTVIQILTTGHGYDLSEGHILAWVTRPAREKDVVITKPPLAKWMHG